MAKNGMTPGVKNALSRGDVHSMCKECGFPLPKYPGRYPKACPSCGEEREVAKDEEVGSEITIGGRTGTIVEEREDELVVEWPDGAREVVEL